MPLHRKKFLSRLGGAILATQLPFRAFSENHTTMFTNPGDFSGLGAPGDEAYWKKIARKYYPVTGEYINLENGFFGAQPRPVTEAFLKHHNLVVRELSRFARKEFPALSASIKKQLAGFLQVSDEEIIITRNATEALNMVIQGYPFAPGDEVIVSQLDYFSMVETFQMLEQRGLIKVNNIELPLLPANDEEIVAAYQKALTPKTRVILLTHVSNINGLIVPVAKISAMAKQNGIDTITDSAHALGQIPFSLPELGSPFVGMNLHKWIGNPVGAGVLYIKKERIPDIKPLFGDVKATKNNINKLAHFGTTPFAIAMTIPDSLAFHRLLGTERITQRLNYLKNLWVSEMAALPAVEMVTPAPLSCAIASFRVKNKPSAEVADYLFKQHNILTIQRDLGATGCIRVTPSVYNTSEDMRKLVAGIKEYVA